MASNTLVLVTGLLTPLCTDFIAFSVRMPSIFHWVSEVIRQYVASRMPRTKILQQTAMAFDAMILPNPAG